MSKMDEKMDAALEARVAELHAHDDESGDGRINSKDLKLQLDRIEAQLELQDQQNRSLLKGQRVRLWLTVAIAVVLCAAVAFLWVRVDQAYANILETSSQVNAVASRLQESMAELDNEELTSMMEDLPVITEKLSALDIDALNEVLARAPALMDAVTDLQSRVEALQSLLDGLKGGLGSIGSGIGGLLGGLGGGN